MNKTARYLLPVLLAILLPILPTPVSASEVNITNTPSSYDFGVVNTSSTYSTGLIAFNITNTGDVAVNISISGTNMAGGTPWVLSNTATPGVDQFGLKVGIGTGDEEEIQPSTVGASTSPYATMYAFQSKSFYANDRFWVFYGDGSNMVYSTSTDNATWSEAVTIRGGGEGDYFSIWFDGVYLHYGWAGITSIYYRRGIPNSNGTITWSADEQTVSTTYNEAYDIQLSVDAGGYVWIFYQDWGTYPYVIKSGNNNGTWGATPGGFPYQLSATSSGFWSGAIIPLTDSKMLAIYTYTGVTVKAKCWNGTAWGGEKTTTSTIQHSEYFSAVAQDDDVYLVFLKETTYDIIYSKYTYTENDFGAEAIVQATTTSTSAPVISTNTANNYLYCFWAGSPIANHIYYKKYSASSWATDPTDWITEADNLTGNNKLSAFYQAYGNYTGLMYMAKTDLPYNVRFSASVGDYDVIVKKDSPYNNLCTDLSVNATQGWGLKLYTPTGFSDGNEKSGVVTLTATEVGNPSNVSYTEVDIYGSPNYTPLPPASVIVIHLTTVAFVIFGVVVAFTYFRQRLIETMIALILTAVGAIILLQVLTVLVN